MALQWLDALFIVNSTGQIQLELIFNSMRTTLIFVAVIISVKFVDVELTLSLSIIINVKADFHRLWVFCWEMHKISFACALIRTTTSSFTDKNEYIRKISVLVRVMLCYSALWERGNTISHNEGSCFYMDSHNSTKCLATCHGHDDLASFQNEKCHIRN